MTKQPKPRRQTPTAGSKTQAILTLATTTPATPTEIAAAVDSARSLVYRVCERYGIDLNASNEYRKHRADVLAGLQERILQTVDKATIEKASLMQRAATLGILYDKERLERGEATQIVDARELTIDLTRAYEAMRQAQSGVDAGSDSPIDAETIPPTPE